MAKRKHYTSPTGTLWFPKLNTPTQFKGKGTEFYETCLDVEGARGAKFAESLKLYAEQYGQRVGEKVDLSSTIRDAVRKEGERLVQIPNMLRFRFKVVAETTSKDGTIWHRKPSFVDENGLPFADEPQVWGGTVAAIVFDVYEWEAQGKRGMTLQPLQVRIVELVTDDRDMTEAPPSLEDAMAASF